MSEVKIPDDLKERRAQLKGCRVINVQPELGYIERIARAEAELSAARETIAVYDRLRKCEYVPWQKSGGVNECKHGYAAAIPCEQCDCDFIAARLTAQQERSAKRFL